MTDLMSSYAGLDLERELRSLCERAKPHQAIVPERKLAEMYGISHSTVRRITEKLVREGLIYKQRGRGTFVAERHLQRTDPHTGVVLFLDPWGDSQNRYHLRFVRGMVQQAERARLRVELADSESLLGNPQRLNEALARDDLAGLVLPNMNSGIREMLKGSATRFPIILLVQSPPVADVSVVSIDYYGLGRNGAVWLLDHTSEQAMFVALSRAAADGIFGVLRQRGRDDMVLCVHDPRDVGWIAEQILERTPQGIMFDDDIVAQETLSICRQSGWEPANCTILSYANVGGAPFPMRVNEMRVDGYDVGQCVINALSAIHAGWLQPGFSFLVRPILIPSDE